MSKIVIKIIDDFPDLKGIYNISSAPISKYSLLKKINDIFDLNIKIESVESKSSDKSLDSRRFSNKTGIEAGLILCTLRHFSKEMSGQTVRLVNDFKGTNVIGFDKMSVYLGIR